MTEDVKKQRDSLGKFTVGHICVNPRDAKSGKFLRREQPPHETVSVPSVIPIIPVVVPIEEPRHSAEEPKKDKHTSIAEEIDSW